MSMFWWYMARDNTPIPEFGRALPVKPITRLADIAVAAVPALTVVSLVVFPDGSPTWFIVVRGIGLMIAAQATIQWVRHLVTNLRLRQRRPILGKMMAFFGWFLPPFVPILPALQFSELAGRSAPPGRSSAGSQLLVFFWFLTALAWAATQAVAFQYWIDAVDALPADAPIPFNTTPREWLVYAAAAQVVGALAFIAMTQSILRQHVALMDATAPPPAKIAAQADAWRVDRPYAAPGPGMPPGQPSSQQWPPTPPPPVPPPPGMRAPGSPPGGYP